MNEVIERHVKTIKYYGNIELHKITESVILSRRPRLNYDWEEGLYTHYAAHTDMEIDTSGSIANYHIMSRYRWIIQSNQGGITASCNTSLVDQNNFHIAITVISGNLLHSSLPGLWMRVYMSARLQCYYCSPTHQIDRACRESRAFWKRECIFISHKKNY